MYADFSRDDLNSLLQDMTAQSDAGEVDVAEEAILDEAILNHMEHMRFRQAAARHQAFKPRQIALPAYGRAHPADFI